MPKVLTRKKSDPRLLKCQNYGFVRLVFAQAERQQARQKKIKHKIVKTKKQKDFSEISECKKYTYPFIYIYIIFSKKFQIEYESLQRIN